jgi:hypothetical protein
MYAIAMHIYIIPHTLFIVLGPHFRVRIRALVFPGTTMDGTRHTTSAHRVSLRRGYPCWTHHATGVSHGNEILYHHAAWWLSACRRIPPVRCESETRSSTIALPADGSPRSSNLTRPLRINGDQRTYQSCQLRRPRSRPISQLMLRTSSLPPRAAAARGSATGQASWYPTKSTLKLTLYKNEPDSEISELQIMYILSHWWCT